MKILNLIVMHALLVTCFTSARSQALSDWTNLSPIAIGSKLSVRLKNGKSLEGNLESVSSTDITLFVKNRQERLVRDNVQKVFFVRDRKSSKPVILGSIVGAAVGIAGVAAVDRTDDRGGVAAEAYLLPIIGAGIGALVGSLFRRQTTKQLIYEN